MPCSRAMFESVGKAVMRKREASDIKADPDQKPLTRSTTMALATPAAPQIDRQP
jgi:hypothetical protein